MNAHLAGKAHGGDPSAVQAAWGMLQGKGPDVPYMALLFAWGTLYGAAQIIDPTATDRLKVKRTLLAAGVIA